MTPNSPIIKASKQHFLNLAARGYGLYEGETVKVINYPRNFSMSKISKVNKFKLYKDKILGNYLILYDYTKTR